MRSGAGDGPVVVVEGRIRIWRLLVVELRSAIRSGWKQRIALVDRASDGNGHLSQRRGAGRRRTSRVPGWFGGWIEAATVAPGACSAWRAAAVDSLRSRCFLGVLVLLDLEVNRIFAGIPFPGDVNRAPGLKTRASVGSLRAPAASGPHSRLGIARQL